MVVVVVVVAMEVRKTRIRAHLLPQQERVKTPKDMDKVKVVEGAGEEVQRRDVKKDKRSKYSITVSAGFDLQNLQLFHVA